MELKIYLISQIKNNGYDTYDSAVVIAENEEGAKKIHPGGHKEVVERKIDSWDGWANLKDIEVEYIGEAKEGSEKGVVVASFNAG